MGIDTAVLKVLLGAHARRVDFSDLAMIGRQEFFPARADLQDALRSLSPATDVDAFIRESGGYGEHFLKLLGAKSICSIDASAYEGATHVHDMNSPIDVVLKSRFSVVLDGGTLEHVFHFPQAIRNCMEMVRKGGHFIQITAGNSYMGHGFYQFSPELIYRIFAEENGYDAEVVMLHEVTRGGRWWRVLDPKIVGRRSQLSTGTPLYLITVAQRISDAPIFEAFPQQSDYVATWQAPGQQQTGPTWRQRLSSITPTFLRRIARQLHGGSIGRGFDRDFYHRIAEHDVAAGRWAGNEG